MCNAGDAELQVRRLTMAQADFDAIRARAYKLLEEAGKPQGRIDVFWYEAEQQLKKEKSPPQAQTPDTERP
jgi:hypothetical protein